MICFLSLTSRNTGGYPCSILSWADEHRLAQSKLGIVLACGRVLLPRKLTSLTGDSVCGRLRGSCSWTEFCSCSDHSYSCWIASSTFLLATHGPFCASVALGERREQ